MGRVPGPGGVDTVSRQEPATVRVTVVGGGLAGMAAALACVDAGAEVTLWEAKKWLGGATSSFDRDGLTIDTGQHVFLRCCVAYREFLRRVGMEGRTDLQSRLDIPIVAPGGRTSGIRRTSLPAPLHLGRALLSYRFLSLSERVHAAITGLAIRRLDPRDPAVDEQAFGTWLRARGESPRAIRALWDLIGLPTLNVEADGASLALAAKVFRTGLLDASGAADIGVPIVPLQELHGDAGLRALRAAGATVRLGERVRGLAVTADGVTGVETDAGTVAADAAIIAVPNDRVGDVLPDGAVPDPPRSPGSARRPSSTSTSCTTARCCPAGSWRPSTRRCSGCSTARGRPASSTASTWRSRCPAPMRSSTAPWTTCGPSSCRPSRRWYPGPAGPTSTASW